MNSRIKRQFAEACCVLTPPSLWQAVKPPELNPETEESLPSRRSPEGPDPPVLTEVTHTPSAEFPPDLESVEKKMNQGHYNSVVRVFLSDVCSL